MNWDPQTRTGKLAILVDLVTPSPVDNADNCKGKLREREAEMVEANKSHRVISQPEIKMAMFISMAPREMKKELFKKLVFAEEDLTYEEAKAWAGRMRRGDSRGIFDVLGKYRVQPSRRIGRVG